MPRRSVCICWLDSITSYTSNTDSSSDTAAVVEHENVWDLASSPYVESLVYRRIERKRERERERETSARSITRQGSNPASI